MRQLRFYVWLLNRSKGTELVLSEVDGSYIISGTLHELTKVSITTNNRLVLVETLKRLDKYAKAHYELQTWNGAQAIEKLVEVGISERIAVELVHQCLVTGRDPQMLVDHPEYVKVAAAKLEEMMDRD